MCKKDSYWGTGGGGIVFVCSDDSTVFLQRRSHGVSGGAGQFGFPGGGIHLTGTEQFYETPIKPNLILDEADSIFHETALSEAEEECGSVPGHSIVDTFLYEDCGFKYKTFIGSVSLVEKKLWFPEPQKYSSWEIFQREDGSYEQGWYPIEEFPKMDLFFGFTPQLIGKIIAAA